MENGRKKKINHREESQAIQATKSEHANYKWIKYMFTRIDTIEARLDKVEKTVNFISNFLVTLDEERKKAAKKNE